MFVVVAIPLYVLCSSLSIRHPAPRQEPRWRTDANLAEENVVYVNAMAIGPKVLKVDKRRQEWFERSRLESILMFTPSSARCFGP